MIDLTKCIFYMYLFFNFCIAFAKRQPVNSMTSELRNYNISADAVSEIFPHSSLLHDHPQLCLDSTTAGYNCSLIICSHNQAFLASGYCATFSEDKSLLSIVNCPFFEPSVYNITDFGYMQLPRNLSQLNDYMCSPLNRKGLVCSECTDGFGPSITSFGYKCANCTDSPHGVLLYLFLEFVPITVFYLIVLVFQISVTSAPMPCFIMYAQWVTVGFYISIYNDNSLRQMMFTEKGDFRLDMKILHVLYGVFNLDFFNFVLPPICVSKHLKTIHLAVLGYISVFYPIVLICLTWVCVELHGYNFRPIVWLWRPLHRTFYRLRRGWNPKSDLVDVFITFFLFSYSKCMYQTLLLMSAQRIRSYNGKGGSFVLKQRALVDLSVPVGSRSHLMFLIPSIVVFLVYSILPPIVLILYPFKAFQSIWSRCNINFISVNIFIEKMNSCFRNGLDGGRDMRSFSGLYFFLRMATYLVGVLSYRFLKVTDNIWLINEIWYPTGTVFLITALTIALVKPYQKSYMNYLDVLLLSNLALCSFVMTTDIPTLLIIRILFITPISIFILTTLIMLLRKFFKKFKLVLPKSCCDCCTSSKHFSVMQSSTQDTQLLAEEKLPFLYMTNAKI